MSILVHAHQQCGYELRDERRKSLDDMSGVASSPVEETKVHMPV